MRKRTSWTRLWGSTPVINGSVSHQELDADNREPLFVYYETTFGQYREIESTQETVQVHRAEPCTRVD